MSDLYDSLEDECDENIYNSGSQNEFHTPECTENNFQNQSPKKYSFYLKRNSDEDEKKFRTKIFLNEWQKKSFLPRIQIPIRGTKSVQNLTLKKQILNEHGLQLNSDGSITKSPRWENEGLPFVAKEYKNIQFQKKKTHSDNKKIPFVSQRKVGGETGSIPPKWRRKSSENFLCFDLAKENRQVAANHNMTDSMKERLFSNKKDIGQRSNMEKNFRKTKSETISSETRDISRQNDISGDRFKNFRCAHHTQNKSTSFEPDQKQGKSSKSKVHCNASHISLPTLRPKLNYSERHKLENGFNVFHLKQFNKKVESDTNRSNFGDSVVEELPEVASVPETCHVSEREDEESFYQKLIERDKLFKRQIHLSARSEGPVYVGKLKSVLEERKNIFKCRNAESAMKIDLDVEVDNLVNSFKKSPHFCFDNSSTKATKVELALKGKTYGYLANARNIFRLKAQLEKKQNVAEKEEVTKATIPSHPKKVSDVHRGTTTASKAVSPTIGIFPNVKGGLPRYLDKSPGGYRTLSKTKLSLAPCEIHKKLVLPQVVCRKGSFSRIQNERGFTNAP